MASKPEVQVLSPFQKEDYKSVVRALQQEKFIAMDCEGVHLSNRGPLTLMQIGTVMGNVYLFDVMKNEKEHYKSFFNVTEQDDIMTSSQIVKIKALQDIRVTEISAYKKVIQDLKYGYIRVFLNDLEDLKNADTFVSTRSLDQELYDIENNAPEDVTKDASRPGKHASDVITKKIQRKYASDCPVTKKSEPDIQALRYLRPITEEGPAFPPNCPFLALQREHFSRSPCVLWHQAGMLLLIQGHGCFMLILHHLWRDIQ